MIYEEIVIKKKTEYKGVLDYHTITFVLEGDYGLVLNDSSEESRIKKNRMYVLPRNTTYKVYAHKDTMLLSINIETNIHIFKNVFSPAAQTTTESNLYTIAITEIIHSFLNIMRACVVTDEDISVVYAEVKLYELAYLIKNNYSPEASERLFHSILDVDHLFIDFVTANFMKVKSVQELASLYNSSLSAFYKLFHKNFKQSPYSWMKTQKTINLRYMICHTGMTMTEISDALGFSSLSQFSTYCKTNLGEVPSIIRKKIVKKYK